MKKRILCFGDSNTYGSNPAGGRFDEATRFPMRLAALLGPDYTVLEEGLGGRTICFDDPVEGGYKSGAAYLPPCLLSHNPLDVVVLMLGTNDAKQRFGMNAHTIAQSLQQLVMQVRLYGMNAAGERPRTLIVAPPHIGENLPDTGLIENFGVQAIETSHGFAKEFSKNLPHSKSGFFGRGAVLRAFAARRRTLNGARASRARRELGRKVRAMLRGAIAQKENERHLTIFRIICPRASCSAGAQRGTGRRNDPPGRGTHALIHYGGSSALRSGLIGKVEDSLQRWAWRYALLGDAQPNPLASKVCEGIRLIREEKIDFIIAVGGGSAMDSAKAMALGAVYEGDFWDFFCGKAVPQAHLPVGTVLTIAASAAAQQRRHHQG